MLGDIASFISVVGVIILGILEIRNKGRDRKAQTPSTEANAVSQSAQASKAFAEASELVTRQKMELEKRVETLENSTDILEAEIEALKVERENYYLEREALKDWADRLVHQVRAIAPNVEPVSYFPPKMVKLSQKGK